MVLDDLLMAALKVSALKHTFIGFAKHVIKHYDKCVLCLVSHVVSCALVCVLGGVDDLWLRKVCDLQFLNNNTRFLFN